MDGKNKTVLAVRAENSALRNRISQVSAIQRAEAGGADYVPHIGVGQVKLMAAVAGRNKRHGAKGCVEQTWGLDDSTEWLSG